MAAFHRISIFLLILLSPFSMARGATPPSADQAFQLTVARDGAGLTLVWTIGPGSYLYRAMIAAKEAMPPEAPIRVDSPPGIPKDDPDFGPQEIYRDKATAVIAGSELEGLKEIILTYQGCAEQFQICYPPVFKTIDLQILKIRERADAASSGSSTSLRY